MKKYVRFRASKRYRGNVEAFLDLDIFRASTKADVLSRGEHR